MRQVRSTPSFCFAQWWQSCVVSIQCQCRFALVVTKLAADCDFRLKTPRTRVFSPPPRVLSFCWLLTCAPRLGFMRRKCRRMMAFTSDRLYIVRVDDGKAKASYPLKSVQLAPSDKVNQVSAREYWRLHRLAANNRSTCTRCKKRRDKKATRFAGKGAEPRGLGRFCSSP